MGRVNNMQEVAVDILQPYERNAKLHPQEQIEKIMASIQEFGFLSPCLIDKDNNIIAGHGRVEAAKALGMATVPCIYVEGLTDEQRRAYILADNRLTELGGWDMDIVEEELEALSSAGFNAGITGFDWEQASTLEAIAKRGDIWKLGDHRLMCGDSTDAEDMARLFNGARPVMVFTDPPYGVAIGSKNKLLNEFTAGGGAIEEDIEGDTLSPEDLYEVLVRAMSNLRENCEEFCSYYVTSPQGGELGLMMMMMMRDAGLAVRHMLIWVKSSPTFSLGRLDYNYRHEPVFYTWTKSHRFRGGYDQTIIDDNQRLEGMTTGELKELVHALRGDGSTTAIYCDKPTANKLHPTMKPIKLIARFIYNSSEEGEPIADIFGGSGSTMIAAEQLGRKCYMMELDPHYCDIIIDRWEQFTGRKAEKIS